jgi:hypothetical protein
MVAHQPGPLLPKLRGQVAEFLQHPSLKRLGMLYQSTCVGFGYGLWAGLFPGTPPLHPQSAQEIQTLAFVTTAWPRTLNLVPIDYACRPRLRGRLTLRGLTVRRNPWTFGESVSHTLGRYSCQHSHSPYLQPTSRLTFPGLGDAPLPRWDRQIPASAASVGGLSPATFSAQAGLSRPVSYYAFFQGWLLLSQPPGCHGLPTSFATEPPLGDLSWRSGLFPSRRSTLAPSVCLPECVRRYSEFGEVW